MQKILLVVEKSKGELFGRVQYEDDLLIESAKTVEALERKIQKLLKDFHGVNPSEIELEHVYDLTALFDKFGYLKISSLAEIAEINPALLRQYASGVKHPSAKQAKKLEQAIHKIGNELSKVGVFAR